MAEGVTGEIRLMARTMNSGPPTNWMLCDGSLLSIKGNYAELYGLIGTTYGGDGVSTFALPDLRGRVPVNIGRTTGPDGKSLTLTMGMTYGQEQVTLTEAQMPVHNHAANATQSPSVNPGPGNAVLAAAPAQNRLYVKNSNGLNGSMPTLEGATIGAVGGGQPHENRMPSMAMVYMICVQGLYPPYQ